MPTGLSALEEVCAKNIHPSTRHVSPFASQYAEHQHKFFLAYLSCVTVVLSSEPRPVVHVSHNPLRRSTAGWYFYGIPLLHSLSTGVAGDLEADWNLETKS